jgi:ABC-type Fe3+ transport system permease subunit
MRNRKILLLILLVTLALPAMAHAGGITMEYKVYGGFDAIHLAFKKIGRIFKSCVYN